MPASFKDINICPNCGLEGYTYIDMDGKTHHVERLNLLEECPECGTKIVTKKAEA